MRLTTTASALLLSGLALLPVAPAAAGLDAPGVDATATGCVSNAAYGQLSIGQRLGHVRRTAGDHAQISMRRWTHAAGSYQERHYRMCTPTDAAHGILTVRFMQFQGAWRAQIVDTMVGPEPS
jgi:hypothetical protein